MSDFEIINAHQHSIHHREEILASQICGCFYCLAIFAPSELKTWCDDDDTALCPECGIDSVIGDAKIPHAADPRFLREMHAHWFFQEPVEP